MIWKIHCCNILWTLLILHLHVIFLLLINTLILKNTLFNIPEYLLIYNNALFNLENTKNNEILPSKVIFSHFFTCLFQILMLMKSISHLWIPNKNFSLTWLCIVLELICWTKCLILRYRNDIIITFYNIRQFSFVSLRIHDNTKRENCIFYR